MSIRQNIAQSARQLETGDRSLPYQQFLESQGLNKKEFISLPEGLPLDVKESINLKLKLLNLWNIQNEILLSYYKNTGSRGLTMYNELINLKVQILERERFLIEKHLDPLDDDSLHRAKIREFEIMKFLERIKFEKEKAVFDKSSGTRNKDDVAFTIELSDQELKDGN